MKKDIELLKEINYLLTKRNEFLQDLVYNIREYLKQCKNGITPLDIDDLLKMLD